MPLPIAHGLFGSSFVAAVLKRPLDKRFLAPLFAGAVLSVLPDFDFLLVFATGNDLWHRGFTHSIFFAVFVGWVICLYFGRGRRREGLAYALAFASHFILDFSTTKIGGGLQLFFPFSEKRYGLRWFGLSEFPSKMAPVEVIRALSLEFVIFFSLFVLVIVLKKFVFGSKEKLK
jgi:inner membrane protein